MTKNGSSHTILLVEDEFPVAMEEARMLEQHGFEVMTVYDARTAIDAVKNNKTDLILMDIELGERNMDGSEAAQVIQKDHDVPIVFLTGHAEKEYVDRVKEVTNYGYVLKNSGEFVLMESVNGA